MTLQHLAALLARRWYLVVAVLACVVAVVALLPRSPGTYYGRATVVFTPPLNPQRIGNVLEGSDPSLIYFAAAVERVVDGNREGATLSSNTAALYGTGVREGHTLTLINTGGQWQSNYNRPMIVAEVVSASEPAAQQDLDSLMTDIETVAQTMQEAAGAPKSRWIVTEVSPSTPQVSFVPGNWIRGTAGVLALGLGLSIALPVLLDRALRRRRVGARHAMSSPAR